MPRFMRRVDAQIVPFAVEATKHKRFRDVDEALGRCVNLLWRTIIRRNGPEAGRGLSRIDSHSYAWEAAS